MDLFILSCLTTSRDDIPRRYCKAALFTYYIPSRTFEEFLDSSSFATLCPEPRALAFQDQVTCADDGYLRCGSTIVEWFRDWNTLPRLMVSQYIRYQTYITMKTKKKETLFNMFSSLINRHTWKAGIECEKKHRDARCISASRIIDSRLARTKYKKKML